MGFCPRTFAQPAGCPCPSAAWSTAACPRPHPSRTPRCMAPRPPASSSSALPLLSALKAMGTDLGRAVAEGTWERVSVTERVQDAERQARGRLHWSPHVPWSQTSHACVHVRVCVHASPPSGWKPPHSQGCLVTATGMKSMQRLSGPQCT